MTASTAGRTESLSPSGAHRGGECALSVARPDSTQGKGAVISYRSADTRALQREVDLQLDVDDLVDRRRQQQHLHDYIETDGRDFCSFAAAA